VRTANGKKKEGDEVESTPEYAAVRSLNYEVFYGKIVDIKESGGGTATVRMEGARQIKGWSWAATFSELTTLGVSEPELCRFLAPVVGESVILRVYDITPLTDKVRESFDAVPVWTEH